MILGCGSFLRKRDGEPALLPARRPFHSVVGHCVATAVVAIGGVVTDGTDTDGTEVPPAAEVAEVEPPAVVE